MGAAPEVGPERISAAREVVEAACARTPVLRLAAMDELLGAPIAFKAESLQQTGSFKARGVSVKLAALGEECETGVVAGTAGNHGRALAWAARRRGVPCELFVPHDAPTSKTGPAARLGAEVERGEGTVDDCVSRAKERAAEAGLAFVHPFDDPDVVAGQGSVGLELLEEVPDLARVLVPLGGGGLAAGIAIAVRSQRPEVEVFGIQVEACPVLSGLAGVRRAGHGEARDHGGRRDRRQAPRRADAAAGRALARRGRRGERGRGGRRDGRPPLGSEARGRGRRRGRGGGARSGEARARARGNTRP